MTKKSYEEILLVKLLEILKSEGFYNENSNPQLNQASSMINIVSEHVDYKCSNKLDYFNIFLPLQYVADVVFNFSISKIKYGANFSTTCREQEEKKE
jgi:hypothetical protein